MRCAICFIWTFLGLAEKPPSYYVGNIKGCVATKAEVKSVGGLWHTPRFLSICPPKTFVYCICVRVSVVSMHDCVCLMRLFACSAVDFHLISMKPKEMEKKTQLISSRTVVNSHVNFMKLVPMLKFTLESGHIVIFFIQHNVYPTHTLRLYMNDGHIHRNNTHWFICCHLGVFLEPDMAMFGEEDNVSYEFMLTLASCN